MIVTTYMYMYLSMVRINELKNKQLKNKNYT